MPGSSVKGRLRRREYRGYVTDREDGDMWKRTRKRRREGGRDEVGGGAG